MNARKKESQWTNCELKYNILLLQLLHHKCLVKRVPKLTMTWATAWQRENLLEYLLYAIILFRIHLSVLIYYIVLLNKLLHFITTNV